MPLRERKRERLAGKDWDITQKYEPEPYGFVCDSFYSMQAAMHASFKPANNVVSYDFPSSTSEYAAHDNAIVYTKRRPVIVKSSNSGAETCLRQLRRAFRFTYQSTFL